MAAPAERPGPRAEIKPVAPKLPSEDAILGRPLHLDGQKSSIELGRNGAELEVTKLILDGDRLSRSGETCRVDVEGAVKLRARDGANGLKRYQLDFPACPFVFEVLDGAILATGEGAACRLDEADCLMDPSGLWGQGAGELDPKRAEEMLSARARVEEAMRKDFKALYEKTDKDKALRKQIVREQAGFSSRREEICRTYAQEAEFGYCALRLTEARALALAFSLAASFKKTSEEASSKERGPRSKRPRRADGQQPAGGN